MPASSSAFTLAPIAGSILRARYLKPESSFSLSSSSCSGSPSTGASSRRRLRRVAHVARIGVDAGHRPRYRERLAVPVEDGAPRSVELYRAHVLVVGPLLKPGGGHDLHVERPPKEGDQEDDGETHEQA